MPIKIHQNLIDQKLIDDNLTKKINEGLLSDHIVVNDTGSDINGQSHGEVVITDKDNIFELDQIVYYPWYKGACVFTTGSCQKIKISDIEKKVERNTNRFDEYSKVHSHVPNPNVAGKQRLPKNIWSAVSFAISMMNKNQTRNHAYNTAAKHYGVDYQDVASGVAQRGGRKAAANKKNAI